MKFITPVALTLPTAGSWGDIDVSAYVPVGAVGVILHYNDDRNFTDNLGLRKNGSTDDRINDHYGNGHSSACVGIDSNRIFEFYTDNTSSKQLYLVGYFTNEAVFFDNGVNKTPVTNSAWTDIDISADIGDDTAVAAIFDVIPAAAFRKNGSTDNRTAGSDYHNFTIIGLDPSKICETYKSSGAAIYLIGYVKSGVVFNTNAIQHTVSSDNVFEDFSALPNGAIGGIFEVEQGGSFVNMGLRKNGYIGAEGLVHFSNARKAVLITECDTSGIIEGKTSDHTVLSFYLLGYFRTVPTSPLPSFQP